ncbi:BRCA1-associated RING domain protein 1 [Linum grandiflorum]
MASETVRSMNPGFLHLQKLGLELKCPLCLDLLKKPVLLPCDHIFCRLCLSGSTQLVLQCPCCASPYTDKDIRHVSLIENIVSIYKGLDAAFSMSARHSASLASGQDSPSFRSKDASVKPRHCSYVTVGKKLAPTVSGKFGGESVDKCSLPRCLKYDDNIENVVSAAAEDGACHGKLNGGSPVANQVDQLSLDSPSFGDVKGSENDSNDDHCANDTPQNHDVAMLAQRSVDLQGMQEHGSLDSGTPEENLRNSKRQKLNYDSVESNEPMISQTENLGVAGIHNPQAANQLSTTDNVCGFCQSSKVSEDTGPLMHYVNGKMVERHEANVAGALHVHRICIDWAPQVYFVGDVIKNLKQELVRGAKLKCSGCGEKGAALGCYVKTCRRSYHVPCAMEISNCRWDLKNFLVLCPSHSSHKFPGEKLKRKKQQPNHGHNPADDLELGQRELKQSTVWTDSSKSSKEWLFCGSALSAEEKLILVEFANSIGVPVTKFWRPDVTHVIASTNTSGACTRTLKVLMAILNGKWVLTIDWIKACMESKCPVGEEPYELRYDNHGSTDGPRSGRLRALHNTPKLFQQFHFYLSGDFVPGYKKDLQNLIVAAGGAIWGSKEEMLEKKSIQGDATTLVVYNLDPPPGSKLEEEVSVLWGRMNDAQDIAAKLGSQVIGHTWLLESIAAYKLQPLVR